MILKRRADGGCLFIRSGLFHRFAVGDLSVDPLVLIRGIDQRRGERGGVDGIGAVPKSGGDARCIGRFQSDIRTCQRRRFGPKRGVQRV